jgi:hypothetical protein
VSIYDTYRVVITSPVGVDVAYAAADTREGAMAKFDALLADGINEPWVGKDRIRVISEQTWLAAKAAQS